MTTTAPETAMTDWRALCAELVSALADFTPFSNQEANALARARAALAAEPVAAPAGPTDEELALIYHDFCRGCEFMDQGGFEDAARAVLARWGRPAPVPAEGEVAELVALIRQIALAWEPDACLLGNMTAGQLARAADLLERQAAPVPVAWMYRGEPDFDGREWQESWRVTMSQQVAEYASQPDKPIPLFRAQAAPVPVAVSERLPGPEDCDAEGRCWCLDPAVDPGIMDGVPSWEFCHWEMEHTHWLPANALPLPAGEVQP